MEVRESVEWAAVPLPEAGRIAQERTLDVGNVDRKGYAAYTGRNTVRCCILGGHWCTPVVGEDTLSFAEDMYCTPPLLEKAAGAADPEGDTGRNP